MTTLDQLQGQVVIVDVASRHRDVLPIAVVALRLARRLAADGSGLLVNAQESAGESSNQIFLVAIRPGTARRLTNDLSSYSGLGVAPDGSSFVAIRNERRAAIWTMAANDPAKATAITAEAAPMKAPTASPGRRTGGSSTPPRRAATRTSGS